MSFENDEQTSVFYTKLRSGTADVRRKIDKNFAAWSDKQLTKSERERFEHLMEYIAYEVLEKVVKKINAEEPYRRYGVRQLEAICNDAFDRAVRKNCQILLDAKEAKFSIREVRTQASQILASAAAEATEYGASLKKYERAKVAESLKKARHKFRCLIMKIVAYEKRTALISPLLDAREVLADQLERARNKLNMLRHACVKQEGEIMRINKGVLPEPVNVALYPPPPLPELAPSDMGNGLPEESGIYFLWREGVIEYVGLSIRLNQRVRLGVHHILTDKHSISYVLIDRHDLTWAECWYIGSLRPQLNFGRNAHHAKLD
jgi:uncharacterized membrane protein